MNINKFSIFKPSFYDDFQCKTSKCRNNCCAAGWQITIGKSDYFKALNASKGLKINEDVKKVYQRNKKTENDGMYAKMKLNDDGRCPFLNEKSMCTLQLTCGYNCLSSVCRDYPRICAYNNNVFFRTLSLSCEAVSEKLWELKDGIDFVMDDCDEKMKTDLKKSASLISNIDSDRNIMSILTVIIDTLQNRNFSFEQRLFVLGIAMKNLADTSSDSDFTFEKWQEKYSYLATDFNADELWKSVDHNSQKFVFNNILISKAIIMITSLLKNKSTNFWINTLSNISVNIRENNISTDCSYSVEKYKLQSDLYDSFFKDKDYFFENVMVMCAIHIIGEKKDFTYWDLYLAICAAYSSFKFTIKANINENTNIENICDCISQVSVYFLHSSYIDGVVQSLKNNDSDTLASMQYLIFD
ncbi:MAG: flagellin lysine-N-methylase [Oscillospiraceae bacterium]